MARPIKRRWFRILSFDGGPMAGGCLLYLKKIVQECPDFFTKVDLFTGTSDGSFSALFLASHTDEELANGPKIVDGLIELHEWMFSTSQIPNPLYEIYEWLRDPSLSELCPLLKNVPVSAIKQIKRYSAFLSGISTFLDSRPLEKFLEELYTIDPGTDQERAMTLGDLHQKVLILSFNLGKEEYSQKHFKNRPKQTEDTLEASWGPRMYHNLQHKTLPPEVSSLRVQDLAMRSSSLPLFFPVKDGCVDGAVFANNPSMAAFSLVQEHLSSNHISTLNHDGSESQMTFTSEQDVLQFSIGGGDRHFVDPNNNPRTARRIQESIDGEGDSKLWWGYWKWVLSPKDPLRAVKLLLNAGDNGVSYQCENAMGTGNFYRFMLLPHRSSVQSMMTYLLGTADTLLSRAADEAEEWYERSAPWQTSIHELLQAGGLLHIPKGQEPVLGDSVPVILELPDELPDLIEMLIKEPFRPEQVLFAREAFRKELLASDPTLTDEELQERLDIVAAYIYVGSRFAQYSESTLARLSVLQYQIDPRFVLGRLIDHVYHDLDPRIMDASTFAKNVGLFALDLHRQLDDAYYKGEYESSFEITMLWLRSTWLLSNTRELNSVTLRPLWQVFTQRASYSLTQTSTPIIVKLFERSQEIYEEFVEQNQDQESVEQEKAVKESTELDEIPKDLVQSEKQEDTEEEIAEQEDAKEDTSKA